MASSSEDEAPEAVSLAQSKRNVQKSEDALQRARAAEKEKKKEKNRAKDRRLKEQAEGSKRRREEVGGDAELQARMERAMQDAANEMDDDHEDGGDSEFEEDDHEEFKGIDVDSLSEEYSGQGSDSNSDSEDEAEGQSETPENPNHLPDHLFASAFASTTAKAASKRKAQEDSSIRKKKSRKRVRSNKTPKDVVIGSRTIRTLASGPVAVASTLPSAKVKKFIDRSLSLKGT
ncbi:hypothetical protein H0H93_015373, partial [Arthromyces matolae]